MSPAQELRRALRPLAFASGAVAILFFGGFAAWSAVAPLSAAAIASGVVSPEGSRRTVQHLEGGIVQEILVHDGDRVVEGDVLLRLAPEQARASYSARQRQWRRVEAERFRLEALEQRREQLEWPSPLADREEADFQAFLTNQSALFDLQRRGLSQKKDMMTSRIAQIRQEIAAIERENGGLEEQLAVIAEEVADKEQLLARGLVRKPELLLLLRLRAELVAKVASNDAAIARAEQSIDEARIAALSLDTEFHDQLSKELQRVNGELAQLEEALASSQDVFQRTEIVAPVAGTVLNSRVRTVGGIVRPGEPILEIVPQEDRLFVEARLSPNDIDVVVPGLPARIHLIPYAARNIPALEGKVVRVSPDSIIDEATRMRFYEVRIEVDHEFLQNLETSIEMTPGMPADVFIVTGEHSLADYLFAPVRRSFQRAFREE